MIFRVRFATQGGHVHCRLFVAKAEGQTFAKCGDFVVRKGPEFAACMAAMAGVQFLADGCDDNAENEDYVREATAP